MSTIIKAPAPQDTLFPDRWADLPSTTKRAEYWIIPPNGERYKLTASCKQRQVLEALMRRPVCSASACRISGKVDRLKNHKGLHVRNALYQPTKGADIFGVYFLECKVLPVEAST